MRKKKEYVIVSLFILLLSLVFTAEFWIQPGLPATFDGPIHITMIAQFYRALSEGDFPVRWADGFGNYGMPMPLIHQQLAAYIGAILTFLVRDVVVSYHLVYLLAAFFSSLFFYQFLRIHFTVLPSLAGMILFHFAPYRIFNVFVRGAQPEFVGALFIPLILIAINRIVNQQTLSGFVLFVIATLFLILSHPFLLVIGSLLFIPYTLFLLFQTKHKVRIVSILLLGGGLGAMIAGYYLVPLIREIDYFYYGMERNHLMEGQFLSWQNFFDNRWFYFYKEGELTRGNFIPVGLPETLLFLGSAITFLILILRSKLQKSILIPVVLSGILFIFFTLKSSEFVYRNVNFLSAIQHPWRMLSGFMFIPPIILAYALQYFHRWAWYALIGILLMVGFFRFPQLYGKNNRMYTQEEFFFTRENLAATVLNTIWTGVTRDYPVHNEKIGIIEGTGNIIESTIRNSSRQYIVDTAEPLRLVDYTFYFPGWKVYVDGVPEEIEFQDPNFRGVITYRVSAGLHTILLRFENTKTRSVGLLVSSIGLLLFVITIVLVRKNRWMFFHMV
ncbi:hypothetical protein HY468_03555 [Candidatus Roizmanbacteria bacterium]|nr:hypothetical protein [Candidatus Roizmanbacteria bacterium]